MKIQYTILLSLLLTLCNFNIAKGQDFTSTLLDSFISYYDMGVDEKLYIQTDKPYYSSVEDIWIKGYLVDAITHTPFERTNFIYVELIDSYNTRVSRIKIQRDSTGFNGHIKLNPDLKDGEYTLKAYTRWMTNKDPDLFFERTISIISPISDDSMLAQSTKAQTSTWTLKYEQKAIEREDEMAAKMIKEYDLQFFPEGGALIPNTPQIVAFKALAEDGLSVEVTGSIYNSLDEKIADIESVNNGMGLVEITAQEGEKYYAITTTEHEPKPKKFNLPKADAKAVALKVTKSDNSFIYQAITSDSALLEGLNIVVQTRGVVAAVDSVKVGASYSIDESQLFDGVTLISVVNSEMSVISERVIFKKPTHLPTVDIVCDAPTYNKRSKARVNLNILGSNGLPTQGQFAVSVTDNSAVSRDSTKDNALSYLLLSSEIKGHIEAPGLYFTEDSPLVDSRLDLLMMTQGWRRYSLEKILKGELEKPTVPFEDYVRVSGKVVGLFGGDVRKPTINLLCMNPFVQEEYELTYDNTFNLIGLDVPDSARYIVQAKGRFGGKAVHLEVESEKFPQNSSATLARGRDYAPFGFINQSREKFYNDGGLATIDIESVVVTATDFSNMRGANYKFATHSVGREKFDEIPGFSMKNYLRMFPGMSVVGDSLYYRSSTVGVRFLINDLDGDYLSTISLNTDHIERIDFYYGNDAMMFTENEGGVLCIYLRDGMNLPSQLLSHVAHLSLLGYQEPAEFYQPKYDTPEEIASKKQDLRTTLYWSGDITPDINGNTGFDFYTADKVSSYTITVEGVTNSGEICYGESTVVVSF